MAQFVLDTSQLDVDVLGPITFATASASLGFITGTATVQIDNIVAANAPLGALTGNHSTGNSSNCWFARSSELRSAKYHHARDKDKATKENKRTSKDTTRRDENASNIKNRFLCA